MVNVAVVDRGSAVQERSYVDWSCALAGAITAAGISFVMFAFGSGIGLSMVSPWNDSSSMTTLTILTTFWIVLVQVGAFAAGGYLAGRMRRRLHDAQPEEVEFRDGVHGLLVWGAGVAFGAILLAWTTSATVRTATERAPSFTLTSGSAVSNDPTTYAIDTLFRTTRTDPAGQVTGDHRAEATRILLTGLGRTDIAPADRTYLSQLVAARTGLSQPEAEQRVNQTLTNTKAALNKARKVGIVTAFLTAAALLAGLAAAWTAARVGGAHRDQGLIWQGLRRRGTA
jgi:hypothetical protein